MTASNALNNHLGGEGLLLTSSQLSWEGTRPPTIDPRAARACRTGFLGSSSTWENKPADCVSLSMACSTYGTLTAYATDTEQGYSGHQLCFGRRTPERGTPQNDQHDDWKTRGSGVHIEAEFRRKQKANLGISGEPPGNKMLFLPASQTRRRTDAASDKGRRLHNPITQLSTHAGRIACIHP